MSRFGLPRIKIKLTATRDTNHSLNSNVPAGKKEYLTNKKKNRATAPIEATAPCRDLASALPEKSLLNTSLFQREKPSHPPRINKACLWRDGNPQGAW
jgi:hypothetical protein